MPPSVKAFTIFGEIALPGLPQSITELGAFERGGQRAAQKLLGLSGAALTVAGGIAAVGTGLAIAGGKALDFADGVDRGLRRAALAMPPVEGNLEHLRQAALDISHEVPLALDAITAGLAETARAGTGGATETVAVFRAASQAAIATSADLTQTIKGLDTVLDAFNLTAADAAHTADLFVAASRHGVQIEELVPVLERVSAQAQQMGLNIDQTVATVIALVESGVPIRQVGAIFGRALGDTRSAADGAADAAGNLASQLEVVNGVARLTGAGEHLLAEATLAVAEAQGLATKQAAEVTGAGVNQWQMLKNDLTPAWYALGRGVGWARDQLLGYLRLRLAMARGPAASVEHPGDLFVTRQQGGGAFPTFADPRAGLDTRGGARARPAAPPMPLDELRVFVELGRRRKEELIRRLDEELALEKTHGERWRALMLERGRLLNDLTTEHNRRVEEGLDEETRAWLQAAQEKRDIEQGWLDFRLRSGELDKETRLAQIEAEDKAWDTSQARRLEIANERLGLVEQLTAQEIQKAHDMADAQVAGAERGSAAARAQQEANVAAAQASLEAWRAHLQTLGRLYPAVAAEIDAAISDLGKSLKTGKGPDAFGDIGKELGRSLVTGLVEGAFSKRDFMKNFFEQLVKAFIVKAITAALGIASPSKVMMRIGRQTIEGLTLGVLSQRQTLGSAFMQTVAPLTGAGAAPLAASAGGAGLALSVDLAGMPPAANPVAAERDRQWLGYLGGSLIELRRTGFRAAGLVAG